MKIKYSFINGEHTEVEVDDAIGVFLLDSRRKEENSNRVYRRHNLSLDACDYEGTEYGYEDCYGDFLDEITTLTPVERARIRLYAEGYTAKEIGARDGTGSSGQAVRLSIVSAKKKILQFLSEE